MRPINYPNKPINSDPRKRRCALLFGAGYGCRWAVTSSMFNRYRYDKDIC